MPTTQLLSTQDFRFRQGEEEPGELWLHARLIGGFDLYEDRLRQLFKSCERLLPGGQQMTAHGAVDLSHPVR